MGLNQADGRLVLTGWCPVWLAVWGPRAAVVMVVAWVIGAYHFHETVLMLHSDRWLVRLGFVTGNAVGMTVAQATTWTWLLRRCGSVAIDERGILWQVTVVRRRKWRPSGFRDRLLVFVGGPADRIEGWLVPWENVLHYRRRFAGFVDVEIDRAFVDRPAADAESATGGTPVIGAPRWLSIPTTDVETRQRALDLLIEHGVAEG